MIDDRTTKYANDVLSGKIVAGQLVKYAAERHIRDLRDAAKRGFHFRPEIAQRAMEFFPSVLTIPDGAFAGQAFRLLPYHEFIVGNIYGWRRADGKRRWRTGWIECARGQAKTPLLAAMAMYDTFFSGIKSAAAYAIGSTMTTSSALFSDAVKMCRGTIPGCEEGDTLESRGVLVIRGSGELAWLVEHPSSQSKFQALAVGKSMSGPKPVCIVVDETAEMDDAKPIEMWQSALAKSPHSPIMLFGTNTPATDQIVGTTYSDYYQSVVKGEIPGDADFSFIARTDPTDKPFEDESCWAKSLPAIDVTYPAENVRIEVEKARHMASKRLTVARLFFGVPVGAAEMWIDEDSWTGCLGSFSHEDVKNYPCYLALDLAQKNDLSAMSRVWVAPDGALYADVTYWKPSESIHASQLEDKAPYQDWVEQGSLQAVPGKSIEYGFIVEEIARTCASNDVQMLAFDPAFFNDLTKAADALGFDHWEWMGADKPRGNGLMMVRHAQGGSGLFSTKSLWMPRSFQQMSDAILNGRLTIQRNPITTWCAANATIDSDAQGNSWLSKRRSRGRIDGIVAICMAVGGSTFEPQAKPQFKSIWSVL